MECRVNAEVLAIAASDIEDEGAGLELVEEEFDFGPRLVAGVREVWGDLVVDFIDIFGL